MPAFPEPYIQALYHQEHSRQQPSMICGHSMLASARLWRPAAPSRANSSVKPMARLGRPLVSSIRLPLHLFLALMTA